MMFLRLLPVLVLLYSGTGAFAATLTYDLSFQQGGQPGDFGLRMVFDDDVDGMPDAIRAMVTLTPGRFTGYIVAMYVNLTSAVTSMPVSIQSIAGGIEGPHITKIATNTSNVQAGNIGATYSIGIAIGNTGIGGGRLDVQSTDLLFTTPGLSLENFGSVAARVQSVGPVNGNRSGGSKMHDSAGLLYRSPQMNPVPEPATVAGCGAALLGLMLYKRKRRVK